MKNIGMVACPKCGIGCMEGLSYKIHIKKCESKKEYKAPLKGIYKNGGAQK